MNIALLLSGGTGVRLGAVLPKQYMEIDGRPMISFALECLSIHDKIDAIQIVADSPWHSRLNEWLEKYDLARKCKGFSKPGENRQLSILHGLEDIREYAQDSDFVLIHDAARPFLSARLVSDCLDALNEHEGVIPVLPMKDTVYSSIDGNHISALLDRSQIFAGQAPEAFRLGVYYKANRRLLPSQILQINGSTEPAVMAGMDIVMIPGEEDNFKITTRADFEEFQRKVARGKADGEVCE